MEIKTLWIYKPEGLFSTKCSVWVLNFVWFKKKEAVYLGISELKSSQGSSHGAQPSKYYYRGSAFQTEGTLQWWMTLYTYKQYLKCLKLYEKSVRLKKKLQNVVGNTIAFEYIFFYFGIWFLLEEINPTKISLLVYLHIITSWFCL